MMQLATPVTLASESAVRIRLLRAAGVAFDIQASGVDEAALKHNHKGDAAALTLALARAKARAVHADGLVIGADQLLQCDGKLFDKPASVNEARTNLQFFCGKTHYLIGAIVLVRDHAPVWSHVANVALTMRDFSDAYLDAYLAEAGVAALKSVGGYQLEGLGAHLFSGIDGDYFSALGLPLLPLLDALRQHAGLAG